ncbi:type I restriction endonuclease subunit R [Brachyspira sp.]|uniref:type I restriction endonuclease subunit R n=1 Tax=Brachyspira sp. TaxID=1977261 RepID=UPI002637542F|nr:type I restriction endonuclease subunit R [Brachyspira sp.]
MEYKIIYENEIELDFINKLIDLKYTYRGDISDRMSLDANFRNHFENLNKVKLSDNEFSRLKEDIITPNVFSASKILREKNNLKRDDDTVLDYTLVNTTDWCKNEYEVTNQLRMNTENSYHRYDVIILINGIPLVQIELKTLHISAKKAMEQIVQYKKDVGNGFTNSLLCFMQIFIVSNRSNTYYFANNNNEHFNFNAKEEFTDIHYLADKDNKKITYLHDFAEVFLSKCTLGEFISKYIVLMETDKKLLLMRYYQIHAVKAIIDCIEQNRGNGYIWHATGSGKTLTSFKASTLLKDNRNIAKCLFVVDRKDLDKQTRDEFNKFQENCVEENTNTKKLVERLISNDIKDKVIVTTIQKLVLALDENSKRNKNKKKNGIPTYKELLLPLSNKRVVIIFDECHRSQFGENHKTIKNFFPKAQFFGFTGTPIFAQNSNYKKIDGTEGTYATTKDIFEKELHSYTITNAIDDNNVLRFNIQYFGPNYGKAANKDQNKTAIVNKILESHDKVTVYRKYNALFAVSSINEAIEYYDIFKSQQKEYTENNDEFKPLNIFCVFSPPAEGNKDVKQLQEDLWQEKEDNKKEPEKKKEALSNIIDDYNKQYNTNYDINNFDGYYKDVQERIKSQKYSNADLPHNKKIDITIVVDMLLTGFDSKYLNTIYVDKNLKHHGLIQAFSRTNRILNGLKPYGNILDFRYQKDAVDEAISLFSGEENSEMVREIWITPDAFEMTEKYRNAVNELKKFMESKNLEFKPEEISNLKGDDARYEFINKFKEIRRIRNYIEQYVNIEEKDAEKIEECMSKEIFSSFSGIYRDVAERLKKQNKAYYDENGRNDERFEQTDFEYILFANDIIDYDYIMSLISKMTGQTVEKVKAAKEDIIKLLSSTTSMLDEQEDLKEYINLLPVNKPLSEKELKENYNEFKKEKNNVEINIIAQRHKIDNEKLKAFVYHTSEMLILNEDSLTELVAPLNLGWIDRTNKEKAIMKDILPLLKKLSKDKIIKGLSAYEEE